MNRHSVTTQRNLSPIFGQGNEEPASVHLSLRCFASSPLCVKSLIRTHVNSRKVAKSAKKNRKVGTTRNPLSRRTDCRERIDPPCPVAARLRAGAVQFAEMEFRSRLRETVLRCGS